MAEILDSCKKQLKSRGLPWNPSKEVWCTIRRILLAMVLAVSFAGFADAQGEMTGSVADSVKVEIITLELQKLTYLVQNGSVAANWKKSHDSDVIAGVSSDGTGRNVRDLTDARFLSGELFMISQYHFGHRVHVYADGNVAVCNYYADALFKGKDKPVHKQSLTVDVWVKFPDGSWKRIAHDLGHPPTNPSTFPTHRMLPIIGVENHPS